MKGSTSQVLIVEDDESTREFMALALAKHQIESVQASSVGEALMRLEQPPVPETLILDLMLPDAKGTVLLRRIRRDGLSIRVAVVTGAPDHILFSELLRIPPDTVFRKPLDLAALIAWLREGAASSPSP
jgi:DNA-binding response OmpR family regulator